MISLPDNFSQDSSRSSSSTVIDMPSRLNTTSSSPSPVCAFPSWPRRSSLNCSKDECGPFSSASSSSFITDEELFSCSSPDYSNHLPSFPFSTVVSANSPASLGHCDASATSQPPQCQVAHNSARDLVRELIELEKVKRAAKRRKNSASLTRKSRSSCSGTSKYMSPIMEWNLHIVCYTTITTSHTISVTEW